MMHPSIITPLLHLTLNSVSFSGTPCLVNASSSLRLVLIHLSFCLLDWNISPFDSHGWQCFQQLGHHHSLPSHSCFLPSLAQSGVNQLLFGEFVAPVITPKVCKHHFLFAWSGQSPLCRSIFMIFLTIRRWLLLDD